MQYILPRDSEDAFGILHRYPKLSKKCQSKTVVNDSGPGYECDVVFDNDEDSYFCSDRNDPFPWITFEFPKHDVVLTNYSLTYYNDIYSFVSYIVEGKYHDKWYLLDNVTDARLVKPAITATRPIQYPGIFSIINVTMTSPNLEGRYEFRIREFDVFGTAQVKRISCPHKYKSGRPIAGICLIIILIS